MDSDGIAITDSRGQSWIVPTREVENRSGTILDPDGNGVTDLVFAGWAQGGPSLIPLYVRIEHQSALWKLAERPEGLLFSTPDRLRYSTGTD